MIDNTKREIISVQIPKPNGHDAKVQTNGDAVMRGMMFMAETHVLSNNYDGTNAGEFAHAMEERLSAKTVEELVAIQTDLRAAGESFQRMQGGVEISIIRKLSNGVGVVDALKAIVEDDDDDETFETKL